MEPDGNGSLGNERILLPTFRIPTLIHTRSANSKWLAEISHRHPLWIHPEDAEKLRIAENGLVRITTRIGHFVISAWQTEGIRPGIVAASHHMGRWRLEEGKARSWGAGKADIMAPSATPTVANGSGYSASGADHNGQQAAPGSPAASGTSAVGDGGNRAEGDGASTVWRLRRTDGIRTWDSDDGDTNRIWWTDTGVHQNLTFSVQPDPISGMQCWHQRVRVTPAEAGDQYGDVVVDTQKSREAYQDWLAKTRPAPGPGGLRRPLWYARPLKPTAPTYLHPEA